MKFGQALIRCNRSHRKQIVRRSPMIDDQTADLLLPWTHSANEIYDRRDECLSFFQSQPGQFALSRTIVADVENREFTGTRTSVVVLQAEQLEHFLNNIALFAYHIQSSGEMFFHSTIPAQLEDLEVSERCVFNSPELFEAVDSVEAERIVRAISIHDRVAVTGFTTALSFLGGYLAQLPKSRRLEMTFSIGTRMSDQKPFKLLALPRFTPNLKKELVKEQVRAIALA